MRPLVFFLLFISFSATAGKNDTIQKDTTHSVRKASILSACVPGAGQVFNHLAMPKGKKKAFWKVPLIYAGLGVTTYFLVTNDIKRRNLRTEYGYRDYGSYVPGSAFPDTDYDQYDQAGILTLHDQYQTWRDLSILAVGAVYLVQIADAVVEAHFVSFDVSEDLSLNIRPRVFYGASPGVQLSLNFR